VRNVPLYNALVRVFGSVKVANADEAAAFAAPARTAVLNKLRSTPGSMKDRMPTRVRGGEQYRVCCPFCGDRRFRLYISHTWDRSVVSGAGDIMYAGRRAICHNENCLEDRQHFNELGRRIAAEMQMADRQPLNCVSAESVQEKEVKLPTSVPLASPAAPPEPVAYLRNRGFDIGELSENWHVRAGSIWYYPLPCVIFPIYQNNILRAWQARYPAEDYKAIDRPKYFWPAGTQKAWMLYNLDSARFYQAVVLVEGVLDVIRVGPPAVAMFGKSPSAYQEKLLATHWANGRLVWLPDANDPESVKVAIEKTDEWNRRGLFRDGAVVARLKEGDPGSTERGELWNLLIPHAPCLSRFAARPIQ